MNEDQLKIITKQLADLNEGFLKLYQVMSERFDEAAQEVQGVRQQVSEVYSALDAIAKQQEIDQHERLAMNHQLDRHERWHHQAADKLGLKLSYQEP